MRLILCFTLLFTPAVFSLLPSPSAAETKYTAQTRADFKRVRAKMLPVAKQACIEVHKSANHPFCRFRISVVSGGKDGAFARFSIDHTGRPRIRISSQMLKLFGNEHELALVLGHEIGHQLADHVNQSQRNLLRNALNATEGSNTSQKKAFAKTQKKDREFELIADKIGAILMMRAGFDLGKSVGLIDRMRSNKKRVTTHPPHPVRKKAVLQTGRAFKAAQQKGKRLALPL